VLYASTWRLVELDDPSGNVPSTPTASIVFTFGPDGAAPGFGYAARTFDIAPGRLHVGNWVNPRAYVAPYLTPGLPPFAVRVLHVLTGDLRWSIRGDRLVIDHPGVGKVRFRRDAAPRYRVTGHLYVDPPFGGERAVAGSVTLSRSDGNTVRVHSGRRGAFTVDLPAGRYAVAGSTPVYNDGSAPCSIPLSIKVGPALRPIAADLHCVEK